MCDPIGQGLSQFLKQALGPEYRLSAATANNRNSHLTLVECGEERYVLKSYKPERLAADPLRFLREEEAYRYMAQLPEAPVPELVMVDKARRALLLRFVDGRRPAEESDIAQWHQSCYDFVLTLQSCGEPNRPPRVDAADSPRSIGDHVQKIESRVDRILAEGAPELTDLVRAEVLPSWQHLKSRFKSVLTNNLGRKARKLIVSPGDLGPHNSLVNSLGKVVFLDFEYFGLDDPIKFLCDLEFGPQPCKTIDQMKGWLDLVQERWGDGDFTILYQMLRPMHALKWALIVLENVSNEAATDVSLRDISRTRLSRHWVAIDQAAPLQVGL